MTTDETKTSGRLAPGERVGPIWMIVLAAFGAWFMVGAMYASVKLAASLPGTSTTRVSFSPVETVVLGLLVSLAVLAVILIGSRLLRPGGLARLGLSVSKLPPGIYGGLFLAVVVVPAVYASSIVTQAVWQHIGKEHPDAHPLLRIFDEQGTPILRAMVMVSAIILAPIYEELLFRGHLQTALVYSMDRTGERFRARFWAVVVTSLIFAAFHGELWMMPPIFFLSLCLGAVYELSGNLWIPIVVHAAFNGSSVLYFWWEMSHR